MSNKTQTILGLTIGIAVFIAIGEYVDRNKPDYDPACKGAKSKIQNDVLYCWSGNDWVKPERLK